jgi:uncharacterized protein (DUF302 family)
MAGTTNLRPAEYPSAASFSVTLERLESAIAAAGMRVFARIDHAEGARGIGLEMPPTLVLLYGHPKGGTPIMLAEPLTALDLPLRVLLREDATGQVSIAFHPVAPMLRQAGVTGALATRLEPAQQILVEAIL